jgi:transposase
VCLIPLQLLSQAIPLRVDGVEINEALIKVILASEQPGMRCPDCGQAATRVHSRYTRTLSDLPWAKRCVRLIIQVRRFFCDNRGCTRRTFVEGLTGLAEQRARRSARLADTQRQLGLAVGGEAGSRLAAKLTLATSADTLLRLVRGTPSDPDCSPRVVGVDDFAFRKGHRYGTLLVDLERRQRIDLLPDREPATLADWLRQYPTIEVITRDRAQAYIDAATEAAPQALQVADRWHLLKNLREAMERFLDRHGADLKRIKVTCALDTPSQEVPEISGKVKRRPLKSAVGISEEQAGRQARRQARFDEVHALRAQGHSHRSIAKTLKLGVNTVRDWLHRDTLRAGRHASGSSSKAAGYADYLQARWQAGCRSPRQLWLEIRAKGFTGSEASVWRWLLRLRQAEAEATDVLDVRRRLEVATETYALNARQAAWLVVRPLDKLKPEEATWLAQLEVACPLVRTGRELAHRFIRMVKDRQPTALADWLHAAEVSGLRELRSFAAGLRRDLAAVEAALSQRWSNGPTEGHVNRLKLIKRQMFGRAKFDLLRQRVLHAV